jgi:Icc-related predicted phosphoesterase
MRLVCITDLHGRLAALERILADSGSTDAVLLGGDLTNFGSPVDVDRVIRNAQQKAPTVLAVAGNCDSAQIGRRLDELGVGLHGRGRVCGDVGIHGLSAIPPWKRGMYQLSEEELEAALQAGYGEIRDARQHVLLAHVPPHDTKLDRTFFWTHAGSAAVRSFIDRLHPALVFCGHIHEGRGLETIGATTVCNCGFGGHGDYAMAEITGDSIQVDLHSARV